MGVSFAIPIDLAMGAVKQLKATGKVSRGMIGVTLQPIDAEAARGLGLPDTRGALINDVAPGSAGEKAGLRVGDVVRSIDGTQIRQSSDLPPIIGAMPPGTKTTLGILRDGKAKEVRVTLEELDPSLLPGASQQPLPRGPGGGASTPSNPLGLVGQDLDADDRRQAGLKPGEGVGIARIDGLAARESGLQPGDIVLRVGNETVASVSQLDRALAGAKPGQTVMLLVRRGSSTRFFAVTPRAGDAE
jgi:serine protease Do